MTTVSDRKATTTTATTTAASDDRIRARSMFPYIYMIGAILIASRVKRGALDLAMEDRGTWIVFTRDHKVEHRDSRNK